MTYKQEDLYAVVDEVLAERRYQRRRWGVRQPDGSFIDEVKSAADYGALILYQVHRGLEGYARFTGTARPARRLIKILALATADAQQSGLLPATEDCLREKLAARIEDNLRGLHVPEASCTVGASLLSLHASTGRDVCSACAIPFLAGVPVPTRDSSDPVTNMRDGEAA